MKDASVKQHNTEKVRLSLLHIPRANAAGYVFSCICLCVCLFVCNALAFKSLGLRRSFLAYRYSLKYLDQMYRGHQVKVKVTGAKNRFCIFCSLVVRL